MSGEPNAGRACYLRLDPPSYPPVDQGVGRWWLWGPISGSGHILGNGELALCGTRVDACLSAYYGISPEWVPYGEENLFCCEACHRIAYRCSDARGIR